LEKILLADPAIAKRHATELRNVLRPEGIDGFNPYGAIRGEYVGLNAALNSPPQKVADFPVDRLHWLAFHLGQRNRILNRYYLFAREYTVALGLPWSRFDTEVARLRENFPKLSDWDVTIDPFGSLFISEYIDGQLKTTELVRQMHRIEGTLRLSTLLVRIIDENVSDMAIPGFLASVEPELYDPFSGNPMRWDATQRRIYFPDPEYPCAFYVSLRVPPGGSARSASASPGRSGKC
jgi:hypothetical protein